MSITLVANTDWQGNQGSSSSTTSNVINTTGATLLVMSIGQYIQQAGWAGPPGITDTYNNTWVLAGVQANPPTPGTQNQASYLFYASNVIVGSGHTFTTTNSVEASYPSQQVAAFSGIKASAPLDKISGNYVGFAGSPSTVQPGSLTPAYNYSLIVSNQGNFNGTPGPNSNVSINDGFITTNQDIGAYGVNVASSLAYLVQPAALPINPTWTLSNVTNQFDYMTNMAIFIPAITGAPYYTWEA